MQIAIFFSLTVCVCIVLGAVQLVLPVKIPIWVSYALGAIIVAPLINWVHYTLDAKLKEKPNAPTTLQ